MKTLLLSAVCLAWRQSAAAQKLHLIVYEGESGPERGRHIEFAGDHEYREEETLPALARILARRDGFKCSVFITRVIAMAMVAITTLYILLQVAARWMLGSELARATAAPLADAAGRAQRVSDHLRHEWPLAVISAMGS